MRAAMIRNRILAVGGTFGFIATIVVFNLGCPTSNDELAKDPVSRVVVTPTGSVLGIGATVQLRAEVENANGASLDGRTVTWTTSEPAVATVSPSGLVTAVSAGGATVTATSEGVSGTADVTVAAAPVATVTLSPPSASVVISGTVQLAATLKDAAGNILAFRRVDWSSSNPAVAVVGETGAVVALSVGGPITITATSEGKSGTAQITVTPTPTAAFLTGRVINFVTQAGIAGATVSFRDDVTGGIWGSTTTAGDGSFTSPGTTTGIANGVLIEAIATGFVTGRILVTSVPFGVTTSTEPVPLVPTSSSPGGLAGTVRNARTAQGIANATVQLFDNVLSAPTASTTSGADGTFAFSSVAAGTYRLTASVTGFQAAQRTGVSVGNSTVTSSQDLVLSPTGSSSVTIVLTWGASPPDLDSHLTGPNSDATRFHVYYASRGSTTTAPFASLDVDNTSGFGPETITLTQLNSGTYRYSVHDFTNRNSTSSNALGQSGAKVQVYTAAGLVQTYFVPNQAGTLWTVFEMTGSVSTPVITARNTMTFQSDPSTVGSPPAIRVAATTDAELIGLAAREHPKVNPR